MRAAPLLTLLFALGPLSARAQGTADIHGVVTLPSLRDRARPLLIFASKPDDPQLEIQVRTLKQHAPEAADRDLIAIAVPYANPSPTDAFFAPEEAERVRRRFNVAPGDFTVILIGKDGGEKLRSHKPFSMEHLSRTIDAMPMRQDEMRGR